MNRGNVMKYTVTSRTVSVIFHGFIALVFGLMGIWFGFFVVPQYLGSDPKMFYPNMQFDTTGAFLLWFELAVIGLVFGVISIFGLVFALKSFKDLRNDELIVKSFSMFICEGYIAALFFLLQASLLWNLTANGNLVFVIVMSLLIAIILLIATNIPMVKLYDQLDQTPLLIYFIESGALIALVVGVEAALALLGARTLATQKNQIIYLLLVMVATSVVSFVLSLLGALNLRKRQDEKGHRITGYLVGSSIIVTGLGLALFGVLDMVWQEVPGTHTVLPVHLYSQGLNNFDVGFGVMACVLGGILLVFGLLVALGAFFQNKKSVAKA